MECFGLPFWQKGQMVVGLSVGWKVSVLRACVFSCLGSVGNGRSCSPV